MHFTAVSSISDRPEADVVVLPFWQDAKEVEPAFPIAPFRSPLAPVLKGGDFHGKEGETLLLYTGKKREPRLLLLGCGRLLDASPETFRKAVSSAVKLCRQKKWTAVNMMCPEQGEFHVPIAEGFLLSSYDFNELKHDSLKEDAPWSLRKLCLMGIDKTQFAECKRAQTVVEAVNFARDLVNGNADDITPQKLVDTALELSQTYPSLKATILGKKEIMKAGLGLLLAVNRGSSRDPALIILHYQGNPSSKECTALVGKGITYDTGGLNLKPTGSMETMKADMSGAASVLGTLKALAALKLPVNAIGVVVSTENSIDANSYKPGDVYRSYCGKTVEISNTDAEGRLVLADAISYVQDHYKPTRLIDLATLTGGIVVALGEQASGLFSNDDDLAAALQRAGEATYERVWRLPLFPEYKEALKSAIADLKNSADRKASSITGAIFIQEFVKKTAWAHLDIAGTAYLDKPSGYHTTPATGVGVRLLTSYFSMLMLS